MIGICFGGYCPLHQGHLDVIYRSKKETDLTYVVVCGYESEPRGLDLGKNIKEREILVRKFFKDDKLIKVISANDTELGLDESMKPENWKIWTSHVEKKIEGEDFVYYVGEPRYVKDLEGVGKKVRLVGIKDGRRENNISASMIRQNPQRYWNKIASTFRPDLSKRILILGTASEGKTTLVTDISKYYQTPMIAEFGRDYMEENCLLDTDLGVKEFTEFLLGQHRYIQEAIESPNNPGFIISDTDNLVTLMYAKAYTEIPGMKITKEEYEKVLYPLAKSLGKVTRWDKIFLIKPHGKFVNDGLRYMEQSSIEERMGNYKILVELLENFGLLRITKELEGTYLEQYQEVKNYICSFG